LKSIVTKLVIPTGFVFHFFYFQRIEIHCYKIGHPYGILMLHKKAVALTFYVRLDFSPVDTSQQVK
jgi:hypothetical protein